MKNVLFISYDGMTDTLGQSQVLPYLVGLQKKGYNIHILSTEKEKNFQKEQATIQAICNQHQIQWHYISYTKKPPVLSTIKDLRQLQQKAKQICIQHNINIVHCRSYIPALIGQKLKQQLGTKFLFDMRGFWADERKDANLWNVKNPIFNGIYKYFKNKERQFVTQADAIVSLTHSGKKEIESWGIKNAPITVIPCCADFEHFNFNHYSKDDINKERESLGFTSKDLVLSYLGSIGTWYMLDEMLDFFYELKKVHTSAKFLFITKEPASPILQKALEKGISQNDIVVKPARRNEVPLRLLASNLAIFFIRSYYSKKGSSPTKQAEIMGMGLPLICNTNVGDVDSIVKKTNSGIQVHNFSKSGYQNAIKQISDLQKLKKSEIRNNGLIFFDLQSGINHYEKIYQNILRK